MVIQLCFADFFHVLSAITIGAGGIGAPLVLADYKQDDRVRCASHIFMLIAYNLGFTNRKRKYVEEKRMATLKSKQTSIATVRKHLLTVVSLPTPLIFCYPLPLMVLRRATSLRGALEGVGLENRDFFGP
jgi:hypothetical protein